MTSRCAKGPCLYTVLEAHFQSILALPSPPLPSPPLSSLIDLCHSYSLLLCHSPDNDKFSMKLEQQ